MRSVRSPTAPSTQTPAALEENQTVERALYGDLSAFNQLVVTYQRLAFSVAYRMLQDEDAAADAVQDSFIKAYRALHTFRGGVFKSWLLRIVVNTCYDVLRTSRQRYPADSIDEEPGEDEYARQLVDDTEKSSRLRRTHGSERTHRTRHTLAPCGSAVGARPLRRPRLCLRGNRRDHRRRHGNSQIPHQPGALDCEISCSRNRNYCLPACVLNVNSMPVPEQPAS